MSNHFNVNGDAGGSQMSKSSKGTISSNSKKSIDVDGNTFCVRCGSKVEGGYCGCYCS